VRMVRRAKGRLGLSINAEVIKEFRKLCSDRGLVVSEEVQKFIIRELKISKMMKTDC